MKRTILAAAVAAAVLAPSARAQMASPIHVGISAGPSFHTSDAAGTETGDGASTNGKSKVGYNVSGHLGFSLPLFPLGLRADVGYNKFEGKDVSDGFGDTGRANTGIFSGTINGIIKPASLLPIKPYFIAGVGAYRTKIDARVTDGVNSASASTSKTAVGVNGGVGVNFGLGSLSTFLEARYHYVFNKEDCNSSSVNGTCIEHKATQFVPISFGIMF